MVARFVKLLFASPEINLGSRKAKSIPVLNPLDQYGRVFFFSWLGFMVAFLSWYAFPPLVCPSLISKIYGFKQLIIDVFLCS
jgi:NNP family nitrate/nitrite transporter-like MFS transporter